MTALTKRLAEDLSAFLNDNGVKCKWLHSELDAFERVELLKDLRSGHFEALVGVNLLREGLDLTRSVDGRHLWTPTRKAFLRSETSLIQTIGRAARNVNAKVILYADKMTDFDGECHRGNGASSHRYSRLTIEKHGITPETVRKRIREGIESEAAAHQQANAAVGRTDEKEYVTEEYINEIEAEMYAAADAMEFERAAKLRDRITDLRESLGKPLDEVQERSDKKSGRGRRGQRSRGGRVPRPKRG